MKKRRVSVLVTDTPSKTADNIVRQASSFSSRIHLEKDSKKINAKSLIGVLSLSLKSGEYLLITADGEDESRALDALSRLISGQ